MVNYISRTLVSLRIEEAFYHIMLPCCQKQGTLCLSQHDVASCLGPGTCSGGVSLCALFSAKRKVIYSQNLHLQISTISIMHIS